jgi:hypothetical protein
LSGALSEQFAKRSEDCPYVCFRVDRTRHSVKLSSFRKASYSARVKAGLGKMVPAVDESGETKKGLGSDRPPEQEELKH